MNAEIKANVDPKRTPLAEVIPLAHPFTVYIEVTRYCNLRCFYCLIATQDEEHGAMQQLGLKVQHMDPEWFPKVVENLRQFPQGIKRVVFSGLGEPLMNPRLPEMIRQVADAGITDRIDVITNGLLITRKKADELIQSGLTNINISIQGVDAAQYMETCKKGIDYPRFLENLAYLYENRGDIKIYIKVIDATLKSKQDEEKFFVTFGNLADRIYIEHLVVMQQQMDDLKLLVDPTKTFYNEELDLDRKVCGQSFYFLQIGCNFDIFPCPVPGLPLTLSMGNMKEQSLVDIWNGPRRRQHLITMLKLEKDTIPECRGCTCFNAINDPMENLDKDAPRLLQRFL
ncbi:MAG: radical SAM protein [Candidatus Competibacteraceae bacterium]|nr:radical SAM protein [Candidatus Competibacteraceae bacterium]